MYAIDFRHAENLLDIRWNDRFDPETTTAYAQDVKARFVRQGFKPGYLLRIDMTDSQVQTKEAIDAFAAGFKDFPKARRIAIVVGSTLSRLQVRRIMTQPYLQIFDEAEPALEWLMEDA